MKIITTTVAAGILAIGMAATTAQAQSFAPQVPNPTNPFPANPIATNGTPLPSQADAGPINGDNGQAGLLTGRSAAVGGPLGFVGGLFDTGLNTAGAAIGTGLGVADTAVGAGLNGAGQR